VLRKDDEKTTTNPALPLPQKGDQKVYELALESFKDIFSLSDPDYNHFKEQIRYGLGGFLVNVSVDNIKLEPHEVRKNNVLSFIIRYGTEELEGQFFVNIDRQGTIY
jgi:hypothetical protein